MSDEPHVEPEAVLPSSGAGPKPRAPRSMPRSRELMNLTEKDKQNRQRVNKLYGTGISRADQTKIIKEIQEEDYNKFARAVLDTLLNGDFGTIAKRVEQLEDMVSKSSAKVIDKSAMQNIVAAAAITAKEAAIGSSHSGGHEEPQAPVKNQPKPIRKLAKKEMVSKAVQASESDANEDDIEEEDEPEPIPTKKPTRRVDPLDDV